MLLFAARRVVRGRSFGAAVAHPSHRPLTAKAQGAPPLPPPAAARGSPGQASRPQLRAPVSQPRANDETRGTIGGTGSAVVPLDRREGAGTPVPRAAAPPAPPTRLVPDATLASAVRAVKGVRGPFDAELKAARTSEERVTVLSRLASSGALVAALQAAAYELSAARGDGAGDGAADVVVSGASGDLPSAATVAAVADIAGHAWELGVLLDEHAAGLPVGRASDPRAAAARALCSRVAGQASDVATRAMHAAVAAGPGDLGTLLSIAPSALSMLRSVSRAGAPLPDLALLDGAAAALAAAAGAAAGGGGPAREDGSPLSTPTRYSTGKLRQADMAEAAALLAWWDAGPTGISADGGGGGAGSSGSYDRSVAAGDDSVFGEPVATGLTAGASEGLAVGTRGRYTSVVEALVAAAAVGGDGGRVSPVTAALLAVAGAHVARTAAAEVATAHLATSPALGGAMLTAANLDVVAGVMASLPPRWLVGVVTALSEADAVSRAADGVCGATPVLAVAVRELAARVAAYEGVYLDGYFNGWGDPHGAPSGGSPGDAAAAARAAVERESLRRTAAAVPAAQLVELTKALGLCIPPPSGDAGGGGGNDVGPGGESRTWGAALARMLGGGAPAGRSQQQATAEASTRAIPTVLPPPLYAGRLGRVWRAAAIVPASLPRCFLRRHGRVAPSGLAAVATAVAPLAHPPRASAPSPTRIAVSHAAADALHYIGLQAVSYALAGESSASDEAAVAAAFAAAGAPHRALFAAVARRVAARGAAERLGSDDVSVEALQALLLSMALGWELDAGAAAAVASELVARGGGPRPVLPQDGRAGDDLWSRGVHENVLRSADAVVVLPHGSAELVAATFSEFLAAGPARALVPAAAAAAPWRSADRGAAIPAAAYADASLAPSLVSEHASLCLTAADNVYAALVLSVAATAWAGGVAGSAVAVPPLPVDVGDAEGSAEMLEQVAAAIQLDREGDGGAALCEAVAAAAARGGTASDTSPGLDAGEWVKQWAAVDGAGGLVAPVALPRHRIAVEIVVPATGFTLPMEARRALAAAAGGAGGRALGLRSGGHAAAASAMLGAGAVPSLHAMWRATVLARAGWTVVWIDAGRAATVGGAAEAAGAALAARGRG
jgi:hypothetical protein